MDHQEYYRHLGRVQNHNKITSMPVDIMTITGFMDDGEKINHLKRYAELTIDRRALGFCGESITDTETRINKTRRGEK